MKSVGLDTCVVLRLLVGEPAVQAKQALQYLEDCYLAGIKVYVSDLVVAETYHGLCHHYNVPVPEIIDSLTKFTDFNLLINDKLIARRSLEVTGVYTTNRIIF